MKTKHEVLQAHLKGWLASYNNKKKRSELITQLSKTTKMHRKSIGRTMRTLQLRTKNHIPKKRGRARFYDKAVDAVIHQIWEVMTYPCAEVMHTMIKTYIESYEKNKKWIHSDEATFRAGVMSISTLRRRIGVFRVKENRTRGYSSTKPSTMKVLIPIRKSHTWVNLPPGYGQIDTVVHCGDLLSGDLIYSLGVVDYATYWAEYDAQWNKGKEATRETIKRVVVRFPFPILELHPDSGSEFLNDFVYEWTQENNIDMTRSEPNKKNDNMCIEERNDSISRKHLGYVRLDDISLLSLVQDILQTACVIHNHFRPVQRMISKERIGSKWKRKKEKVSVTAYQRVLDSKEVSEESKQKLRAVHAKLDPLSLEEKLAKLKAELTRKLLKNK